MDPQAGCEWIEKIDDGVARAITGLVNSTIGDGGTLGYASVLSDSQAQAFIEGLQRSIDGGDTHILLGRWGDQPVFMVVLTQSGMANCRHRAELSKGVIHPSHRGMGLVRVAFRELVKRAQSLGIEQFVLDVRDGSRAHLLWQHYGFESFGVLDDYARVDGASHRGHFMAQTVDSLRQRVFS